jgi:glutaminase
MISQNTVTKLYNDILGFPDHGKVASYIPELANVNPDKFGVFLKPVYSEGFGVGDFEEKFSVQSIAKVFLLALAFRKKGEDLWERLGYEPSGTSFNSIVQLEYEKGIPRNPLINAGSIVMCDILIDILENPKEDFLQFVRKLAIEDDIQYNETIVTSESKTGYTNNAIVNLLKAFGNIHNDIGEVLDFYYHICSIEMTCRQLAGTFQLFANNGIVPHTQERILDISKNKRINAIMQTCGFYDEAGEFAFKVGLPGKSGVGGGIIAILPHQYTVAVWSPKLNSKGNSYKGMRFLEHLTSETVSSIF